MFPGTSLGPRLSVWCHARPRGEDERQHSLPSWESQPRTTINYWEQNRYLDMITCQRRCSPSGLEQLEEEGSGRQAGAQERRFPREGGYGSG